jgi:predicted RNA-binding Zn ribbon-like protein
MATRAEPMRDVGRMRIVGGNLALNFVNTRTGPPGGASDDDVLRDYGDLVAWARHVGSLSGSEAGGLLRLARRDRLGARDAFDRTVRLRDALDDVFRASATRRRPPAPSVAALRTAEVEALARGALVVADGAFAWSWSDDRSLARPLGPVIHAAIELLTDGPLDRVKACAGCQFLFVDGSKNRSRRWCSMEDCGSNDKMRRFVERRAARQPSEL